MGLLWSVLFISPHAESAPVAGVEGSSGAPAGSAPPAQPAFAVDCKTPTSDLPHGAEHGPISVTVNAATVWQPRGGEVLIAVTGDPADFSGVSFKACFGWNDAGANEYFSADNLKRVDWYYGFVNVRPPDVSGTVNLGVIVPPLPLAPTQFFTRWFGTGRSSGLGLVPVADLRLIAYTKDRVLFDEVRPVGITTVLLALIVAAGALVIAIIGLHRLTVGPQPLKLPKPQRTRRQRIAAVRNAIFSPNWILTLIQTPDGRASLSAFQVLLWTLVVAVSAMYVMTLSGNLINLTSGTLTLLGIAGAAGLIASYTDSPGTDSPGGPSSGAGATGSGVTGAALTGATGAAPSPAAGATGSGPSSATETRAADPVVAGWRDLILDPENRKPDISRTQMLLFTVVSAAFVVIQVLNYYVIPDIPAGYQILIGISNGLYVGRKFTGKA
jgi:hypothetical protein